jgi:hypothetical protein
MTEPRIDVQTMVRLEEVNYGRNPYNMILATRRIVFGSSNYTLIPKAEFDPDHPVVQQKVVMFPVSLERGGHRLAHSYVQELCDARGLMPAHPYALAAVNEKEPELARDRPNITQWWNGKYWSHIYFYECGRKWVVRWERSRNISIEPDQGQRRLWIAGIRQS